MKKIYTVLMAIATAVMTFTSCSESNDAFFTASEDDYPRILNTDIPESTGGEPSALPSITRDQNFIYEVIVTPAQYTTVTWYIDSVKTYEGTKIDQPLLAGNYSVKIVATTTKGKSTYRNCTLEVLPLDSDPTIAKDDKNLWCQKGTKKILNVSNFADVTSMTIGGVEVKEFKNNGSTVEFIVPDVADGNQNVIVTTSAGEKYGCGNVNVQTDQYVDPGVQKIVLWEGANALNWDQENVKITADKLADIPVGTKIYVEYDVIPAEEITGDKYWALRIITDGWDGAYDILPQTDNMNQVDSPYELEWTAARKAIMEAKPMYMSLVGNGLKIKSVYYETQAAGAETTLWEGANALNWEEGNVKITADQLADVEVGKTILVYYDVIPAEEITGDKYWALRIITDGWDGAFDILPQTDNMNQVESPFEIEWTEARKTIMESKPFMSLVGNGLKITKVAVK